MNGVRALGVVTALMAVAVVAAMASLASAGSAWALGGQGTAAVNGVLDASEWDAAPAAQFPLNQPYGDPISGELRAMNDDENLYMMLRFPWQGDYLIVSSAVEFDNDGDGSPGTAEGDDGLVVNASWYPWETDVIVDSSDNYRTSFPPCPGPFLCSLSDTQGGGTNDVVAAAGRSDGFVTIEIAHPLSSGDAHDFELAPGSVVGWTLSVRLFTPDLADTDGIGWPDATIEIYGVPIGALFADLATMVAGVGPGTSLHDKVAEARALYETGDLLGAATTLQAVLHELEAQTGKNVDAALAAELRAHALQLMDLLET